MSENRMLMSSLFVVIFVKTFLNHLKTNMISMKKQLLLSLFVLFVSIPLFAQDDEEKKGVSFGLGADFVSQYVWRGMSMAGASIQPGMTLSAGGLDLTVWGSTEIGSVKSEDQVAMKEVNLIAMYDFGETGFGIGFMDSWTQKKGGASYFNYKSGETEHTIDVELFYDLPYEKFPLSLAWYTMFYGADKQEDTGSQNYSSYFELAYPFKIKPIELEAACGMVPYASDYYSTDGFGVINLSLQAMSDIPLSSHFKLPVFVKAAWNPYHDDVHVLFGLSLNFGNY